MHEKIFICNEREYLQATKQIKDTNKQANKYQACLNISTASTKKKAYLSTSLLFYFALQQDYLRNPRALTIAR